MIWAILRRFRSLLWRVLNKRNLILAGIDARLAHGRLQVQENCTFSVPVRVNGPGQVLIGPFVSLGFRLGPSVGNGKILVQARKKHAVIRIGENCHFSNNVTIIAQAKIIIGSDCLIGDGVRIFDSDFHELHPQNRSSSSGKTIPVRIGDNVWIGSGAMILKGVSITAGSVIAPGAVVTKDVNECALVAGVPARKVKSLI